MVKVCSGCGFEVEYKFNFCPICGSNILSDDEPPREKYKFCPICGLKIKKDTKICPNCGINFDGKFRKIANRYSKKNSVNKILNLGASVAWKTELDLKLDKLIKISAKFEDPGYIAVYESIAGQYLKKLFMLERYKILVGGSDFLGNLKFIPPTQNMSFDESVKFYEALLENLISELNEAKKDENFDEEEYYKKKYKESRIELFANYPL